jgi:hypothetical protein
MRARACVAGLALLAVGLAAIHGAGQDTKPKIDEKTKALMRRKLECSQKILEALTLNDLNLAAKQAEELLKIRKDPAFKVWKTREYELFGDEFTRTAEGIIAAAKETNLEAAKLHYLGMTLTCFNCHSYTRDSKNKTE